MAHYTITIKSLIDNNFDFQLDNYPIFDENYRPILNNKILRHYYENEIGFETAPLFRFYLNQKMDEIMPYYNELYKVQAKLINSDTLTSNVNLTESLEGNTTTNSSSESTNVSTGSGKSLFQDTPQGNISNQNIDDENVYATSINLDKNNSNSTINDTSSGNGTNSYIKTIVGNNGNKYAVDVLNDIKNNLINIDLMIINDLNELFMQIF